MAKAHRMPGDTISADEAIRDGLQSQKGPLNVSGWKARRVDDKAYLVSYSYDQGPGTQTGGWVFEVNLTAEIVRIVIGDPQLEQKYGDWAREQQDKPHQQSKSSLGLEEFSVFHWLLLLAVISIPLPAARILRRAGRSPGWALLCFMPIFAWIGFWVFSFVRWPALDKKAN